MEEKQNNIKGNTQNKIEYISTAPLGTLVAFIDTDGRMRSAKITERNEEDKTLLLETQYAAIYLAPYESIAWVKTGSRWPSGVYKALKRL